MARETIPVRECDRCRVRVEIREPGQRFEQFGWGQAWAKAPSKNIERQAHRLIGGEADQADLCPACADELFAWWTAPVPPAELPEPRDTNLTRKQRASLKARIVDDMRRQVTASIQAVKEQPSSILNADIVPGAFAGIEERAARLVSDFVERQWEADCA